MMKGVPVAGAYVPQLPDMTKLEQERPISPRAHKPQAHCGGTAPLMMAAPAAMG